MVRGLYYTFAGKKGPLRLGFYSLLTKYTFPKEGVQGTATRLVENCGLGRRLTLAG
jgi:hypothetical protein